MIQLNMNEQGMTYEDVEKKLNELSLEKKELGLKKKMGMHMTPEEEDRLEVIDGVIDHCKFVLDWMTINGEEEYDWVIN